MRRGRNVKNGDSGSDALHGRADRRLPEHAHHLVDEANLESVRRDGLLSASRLLERAGIGASERALAMRRQRRTRTCLPDGTIIRDQKPMPPEALSRCLMGGIGPEDWYLLLNSMVFFWFDRERALRQACACRPWPQYLLEVDVTGLLALCGGRAFITPINTGSARRRPARRGRATFVHYSKWLASGWAHESDILGLPLRSASHAPAELTISDAVPDIMKYVIDIKVI
jgi:hypothetical protein